MSACRFQQIPFVDICAFFNVLIAEVAEENGSVDHGPAYINDDAVIEASASLVADEWTRQPVAVRPGGEALSSSVRPGSARPSAPPWSPRRRRVGRPAGWPSLIDLAPRRIYVRLRPAVAACHPRRARPSRRNIITSIDYYHIIECTYVDSMSGYTRRHASASTSIFSTNPVNVLIFKNMTAWRHASDYIF